MSRYKSRLWNMTKENYKIYMDASVRGMWVRYQGQWQTCSRFFEQHGQAKLDMTQIRIEDPRLVLNEGIDAIKKMVSDGRSEADINNALTRLQDFTHHVIKNYTHYHKMPEQ